MKTKLKATLVLLKEGAPLVLIIMILLGLLTFPAIALCKYVSVVWGLFF